MVEKAGEARQGKGVTHGPFPLVATASYLQTRLVGSGLIGLASIAVVSMGETTGTHKKNKGAASAGSEWVVCCDNYADGKPSSITSNWLNTLLSPGHAIAGV